MGKRRSSGGPIALLLRLAVAIGISALLVPPVALGVAAATLLKGSLAGGRPQRHPNSSVPRL